MGKIIGAYIFPHPPILIPEVGKGREKDASATLEAVRKAAREIGDAKPDTIIVTTPHGPLFQDFVHISVTPRLSGDLGRFGASGVRLEYENDLDLVNRIVEEAGQEGIYCGGLDDETARKFKISRELDHGATVPLYFVNKELQGAKLVHISIAGLPHEDLYRFGTCISRAVEHSNARVVFVGSGDLSHRLSADAPYGYSERGHEFDELLVEYVKKYQPEKLLDLEEDLCESAGECGLRSFVMMFGALDGYRVESQVLSYEGPFGVGYAVARLQPREAGGGEQLLEKLERTNLEKMRDIRNSEDPYVALARETLERYVKEGVRIGVPDVLPSEMLQNRAGVFVSIKKKGQLRGCIGTTAPVTGSIAEEIIQNAVSSGTQDPRFNPVEEEELDQLVYSVDVLMKPEPVDSMNQLDVVKYGVIVRTGARSGLLLPNLEGVDTPEKQVSIALQKAGIRSGEKYSMERFEVIRHK